MCAFGFLSETLIGLAITNIDDLDTRQDWQYQMMKWENKRQICGKVALIDYHTLFLRFSHVQISKSVVSP